jgi:hypothetical protein
LRTGEVERARGGGALRRAAEELRARVVTEAAVPSDDLELFQDFTAGG